MRTGGKLYSQRGPKHGYYTGIAKAYRRMTACVDILTTANGEVVLVVFYRFPVADLNPYLKSLGLFPSCQKWLQRIEAVAVDSLAVRSFGDTSIRALVSLSSRY